METKAVIISDTHLGSSKCKLKTKSDCLAVFNQIEDHFCANSKEEKKKIDYLILNGDILEFAIQRYSSAFRAADVFFEALVESELFQEVIYIPGNHDHNVWNMIQQQVSVLRKIEKGSIPKPFDHIQTGTLHISPENVELELEGVEPNPDDSTSKYGNVFLSGIFNLPVNVVYPNLFIRTPQHTDRPILVTHGHFFNLPAVLFTEVFPKTLGIKKRFTIEQLEELNAPVIEFIWTGLGQSNRVTPVVRRMYYDAESGKDDQITKVMSELMEYLDKAVEGNKNWWRPRKWLTSAIIKFIIDTLLTFAGNMEEYFEDKSFLQDKDVKKRIRKYLKLTLHQYAHMMTPKGLHSNFPKYMIFGHTHLPILPENEEKISVKDDGKKYKIKLLNNGGFLDRDSAVAFGIQEDGSIEPLCFKF